MDLSRKKLILFTVVYTAAFLALMGWRIHVRSERGWIGMNYIPVLDSESQGEEMWAVTEVYPGSPADRAGIKTFSFKDANPSESNPGNLPGRGNPLKELSARARVGDAMGILPVDLTIESPLRTPGIVADLAASLFAAFTVLLAGFLLRWRQPGDNGALLFFATTVLAASYSFLDGLRPLDSDFNLEDWGVWQLEVAAGILWVSRGITWLALLVVFLRDKARGLRLKMFVAATLAAALLAILEYTTLAGATPHDPSMEIYSKAAYWTFLMVVGLGILRTPAEDQSALRPQPAGA